MAESVLSKLVKTDAETKEHLESIDSTLTKVYKLQLKTEKREAKQAKREAQRKKRGGGDFLQNLALPEKDKKKAKKSWLESLAGFFKSMGGGLASGLGGLLKTLFAPNGAISKIVVESFKWMFRTGGTLVKGMISALSKIIASPVFWKIAAFAGISIAATKGVRNLAEDKDLRERGRGKTKDGDVFISTDLSAMARDERQLVGDATFQASGRQTLYNNMYIAMAEAKSANDALYTFNKYNQSEIERYESELEDNKKSEREKKRIRVMLQKLLKRQKKLEEKKLKADEKVTTSYSKLQKTRQQLFEIQVLEGRRSIEQVPEEYREAIKNKVGIDIWQSFGSAMDKGEKFYMAPKYQTGGPLTVPGTGSGDKVPMMLPEGSFVMNRNAAALGFQSGGMIPTLLEPGEHVYGPGQWDASHVLRNNQIPRFQTGGVVSASHDHTGTGWSLPGLTDKQGRPAVFSKGAAEAWARMMADSNGQVKGSDINSSKRSPAHNTRVGGVAGSRHLSGNAVDVQTGSSTWTWMKQNGSRYGWNFNNYMGPQGWHFDYNGGGKDEGSDAASSQAQTAAEEGGKSGLKSFLSGIGGPLGEFVSGALGILGDAFGPTMSGVLDSIFGGGAMASIMGGGDGGGGTGGGPGPAGTGPVDMGADVNEKLMNAAKLAMKAGFTKEQAKIMAAIAGGESTFDNMAHNGNRATGDDSYGLWQINMIDRLGPERRRMIGISSNEELFDPEVNARAAKLIFDRQGYGAWGAYKDGNAAKYMNAAQALQLAEGGRVSRSSMGTNINQKSRQQALQRQVARAKGPNIHVVPYSGKSPSKAYNPGAQNQPPVLSAYPSNSVALDLANRTSIGGVF